MPELPEVEIARSLIADRALHRRIVDVYDSDSYVGRPHSPGELRSALTGRSFTAAHRRGKTMWLETSGTGDTAAAIRHLKTQQDGELLVPGSGALVRFLFANDLVDQLDLLTYPVVIGQGTRLFPDAGPDAALELVSSRSTSKGITIQTYRPAGRPQYATSDPTDLT